MQPWQVYLAVGLYLTVTTLLALAVRRGMGHGVEDYFLANRRLGGVISALSYSATTYSAFMMVGLAGLTYKGGVGALGFELIYLSGLMLVAFFGPRFWLAGRKFHIVSPTELLAIRYDSRTLGALAALAAMVFLIPYSSVQLLGIAYLLEELTQGAIPFVAGLTIAAVVSLVWALAGGLRSVAWTDAFQALLMMVAALLAVGYALASLGGPALFVERLARQWPEWLSVPGGEGYFQFSTFLGLSLPWFFFSLSNPQVAQRMFTPRSLKSLRRMLLGFLCFGLVYTLVSVTWGFVARLEFTDLANPDLATPTLLKSGIVPPFVALLAMLGIMAAAISTIDSILLTLASMLARDVYRGLRPKAPEEAELQVGKWVIPVLTLMAFLFARMKLNLIALLSVASSAGLLVLVPPTIGAFFWRRGTAAGANAAIIIAGLTVVWLQFRHPVWLGQWPGVWGLIISTLVFLAVSLVTRAPEERARQFIDELNDSLREHRRAAACLR
ncbi:MAG: sodium:solute symporter family protein [Limnochordales bacterium]|nr:sodium:solute symporter family protein [Limnochordales bacterium]